MQFIDAKSVEGKLSWSKVVSAIEAGHKLPEAEISDQFLSSDNNTLLSRAAWIKGLGVGVKSVTVYPDNPRNELPSVNGGMLVFDDETGVPRALIDNAVITYWKTAGDSVFAASKLARADSSHLLIVGAGTVAESLVRAYSEIFPSLTEISIWNRTAQKAQALTDELQSQGFPTKAVEDLPATAAQADIISTATMSKSPVLSGEWIKPGTHVDLIGAFKPDMREGDDALLKKGKLFVDSYKTTIHHIGELMMPLAEGVISESDILADYYELVAGAEGRTSSEDITIFKNGGGGHLDLMTAQVIIDAAQNQTQA